MKYLFLMPLLMASIIVGPAAGAQTPPSASEQPAAAPAIDCDKVYGQMKEKCSASGDCSQAELFYKKCNGYIHVADNCKTQNDAIKANCTQNTMTVPSCTTARDAYIECMKNGYSAITQ